ncbi:MAG: hypothetical protein O3B13_17225 [Planctomycetota bacterium]|nr:hypothetical protein [Planctomycetota bacterium]MDA1164838.1 hypothetical protein [Planctomycetota bacterium]
MLPFQTSTVCAEWTGSPLIALNGTLAGIMGWHKHWNGTPKNSPPLNKLAWAAPAHVIARLLKVAGDQERTHIGLAEGCHGTTRGSSTCVLNGSKSQR